MELLEYAALTAEQQEQALQRPSQATDGQVREAVAAIIAAVRRDGDAALMDYARSLDHFEGDHLELTADEREAACGRVDRRLRKAINAAHRNIRQFHAAQEGEQVRMETVRGITCEVHTHPIESVGLYVPGGSAPLISTALMLAVPAHIAGCPEIIMCSPPPVADAIIYAATRAGVTRIFSLGGAQAVAAMAYGTASVPRVVKIFGPGNQYVTMAKRLVSEEPGGAAIDMPAGPSEVLVIADRHANPVYVAADLLAQAEHGPDSQVMLLSDDRGLLQRADEAVAEQLPQLPRADIARRALSHSRAILCRDLEECAMLSNRYAPEHLILQVRRPRSLLRLIRNAGSVFLGAYTPEALGDYASGPNHTLPTYGFARSTSALGTNDYRRRYTVSCATRRGLSGIGGIVETLAQAEQLQAHRNSVSLRLRDLQAGR